jgi:N-acetyl sugar amidotransferase
MDEFQSGKATEAMKTCSKCVMPETAETLSFDAGGVCSVCRQVEYKTTVIDWEKRARELDVLIENVRGKYDYDCVVPFSGGKDSTFTLWYLVTQKRLKPLVARFDHGFLRPTVKENSTRTFKRLGVDVLHFTPNWQVVRKLMFESLRRRGDFCWHCHTGIISFPMWTAIRHKVPLIFWGEPSAEYSSFYDYDGVEEFDERKFNLIANLGINPEDIQGMLDNSISDYKVTSRDLKPYSFPPASEIRQLKLRSVPLGSFIPWDVKKQVDIIKRELDWRGEVVENVPPEYDYEKIECFMQGVRDYIKFLKRGFGRTAHLASIDIRNGRMTREEGVALVEKYDGRRPASLDLFLRILEIDEPTFMRIVEPHVVSPHTIPSSEEVRDRKINERAWDFVAWEETVAAGEVEGASVRK